MWARKSRSLPPSHLIQKPLTSSDLSLLTPRVFRSKVSSRKDPVLLSPHRTIAAPAVGDVTPTPAPAPVCEYFSDILNITALMCVFCFYSTKMGGKYFRIPVLGFFRRIPSILRPQINNTRVNNRVRLKGALQKPLF